MGKNLRHELRSEIFAAFSEGASKKSAEEKENKVFSYNTKFQLLDRVNDLCKNLPADVKTIDQLTSGHILQYLDKKSETCSQATVDTYRADLKKLGKIIGVDLTTPRVYSEKIRSANRGADSVISKEDFEIILNYAQEHPSASGTCLLLESQIGVRVSDLAYGITIEPDRLCIRSKGGKIAYRTITSTIRQIINSEPFQKMVKDGKLIAPKDNSINKYLRRTQDKLGLERHSFHDIRRRIAQDKYDECRHIKMSKPEALSWVSKWLNHGESREKMILESYISNPW